jgi:hypothetical protein
MISGSETRLLRGQKNLTQMFSPVGKSKWSVRKCDCILYLAYPRWHCVPQFGNSQARGSKATEILINCNFFSLGRHTCSCLMVSPPLPMTRPTLLAGMSISWTELLLSASLWNPGPFRQRSTIWPSILLACLVECKWYQWIIDDGTYYHRNQWNIVLISYNDCPTVSQDFIWVVHNVVSKNVLCIVKIVVLWSDR